MCFGRCKTTSGYEAMIITPEQAFVEPLSTKSQKLPQQNVSHYRRPPLSSASWCHIFRIQRFRNRVQK